MFAPDTVRLFTHKAAERKKHMEGKNNYVRPVSCARRFSLFYTTVGQPPQPLQRSSPPPDFSHKPCANFHKTKGGSAEPSIRKPGHPLVSALAFHYLCNTMNQPVPHSILSANSLALTRQDNCFDILRYYLALVVFCTHFSVLTQAFTFDWITSSGEAVSGFFCLSGFLVCLSYLKTPDLRTYVSKRLRRILPPYWFIVLLCAFGGVCLTHYTAADTSPTGSGGATRCRT